MIRPKEPQVVPQVPSSSGDTHHRKADKQNQNGFTNNHRELLFLISYPPRESEKEEEEETVVLYCERKNGNPRKRKSHESEVDGSEEI